MSTHPTQRPLFRALHEQTLHSLKLAPDFDVDKLMNI